MSIKARILIVVFILEIAGYSILVIYNQILSKEALLSVRNQQVVNIFDSKKGEIDALTRLMERNVIDLAHAGEHFYMLQNKHPNIDQILFIKKFLIKNFKDFPKAIGGGLWYEPYSFFKNKKYFGPYAYRDKGKVVFSWDLNTPKYDYLNQSWYRIAIPKNWDLNIKRPNRVYWTAPYYDDAGTKALMITVDAFMKDHKGKIIGLATVDWDMSQMFNLIDDIKITSSSEFFYFDLNNKIIVNYPFNKTLSLKNLKNISWTTKMLKKINQQQVETLEKVLIKDKYYHIYFIKTEIGAAFGVMIPSEELYLEVNSISEKILFIGIVVSIGFIILMIIILTILFRPFANVIKLISQSIDKDKHGGLDVKKIAYRAKNEFTPIISALNHVYGHVTNYTNEIEKINQQLLNKQQLLIDKQIHIEELNTSLEHKVSQRTKELEDKAKELVLSLNQLKEMQDQLVNTEKNAALGRLVAGVAHEINTPIGISVTAASHLGEEAKDLVRKQKASTMKKSDLVNFMDVSESSCKILLSNLHRAAELIRNFKQVAVDQSNDLRRDFYIPNYIEEILTSLRPKYKHRSITIEVNSSHNIKANSYPGPFSQVITNLIMNSLTHAFPDNTEGKINIDINYQDEIMELIYKDDGAGIDKESINKIFDPFYTTKLGQGGSGLGLHLVFNIISNRFGGEITCTSTKDEGVVFIIKIPADFEDSHFSIVDSN